MRELDFTNIRRLLTPASVREHTSHERQRVSRSVSLSSSSRAPKTFNADSMKGRLAIRAVTLNLSGQSVMGLTPAYKINYIRNYLETVPDVVFIQDGIKKEDLLPILEEVAPEKYKCEYQVSFTFTNRAKSSETVSLHSPETNCNCNYM